jgi:hypothetical protein
MAGLGHEERFPLPSTSGRCRLGQGTFARACGNDEDAPEDSDLFQTPMQRWHEQRGLCPLCQKAISFRPANRLLQMSRDRTDSANKAYDWENTRLTHLACNLGKSDATLDEWHGYLAMLRQPD